MNANKSLYNDAISGLEEDYLSIIPEEYRELGGVDGLKGGLDGIIGELIAEIEGGWGEIGRFFLYLIGATLILALVGKMRSPERETVSRGAAAILGAGVISFLYPLTQGVISALGEIGDFFSSLSPILTAFLAFGGGEGTAASSAYLLSFTVWITGLVSGGLLIPIVGAGLGTSMVAESLGGPAEAIAVGIKNLFSRSVALVGALLGGVFALQTFITASVDSVALRAVRYAVTGLVPIVGTTVSGAMSTIIGGLSGVGGIIGASSVTVILAISLLPLVYLLLYRLAFALATMLSDMLGGEATRTVKTLAYSLDILISAYVMTTIIYIFEIIVVVLGGNMILGGA